jgi:hypothetical protein
MELKVENGELIHTWTKQSWKCSLMRLARILGSDCETFERTPRTIEETLEHVVL